MLHRFLYLHGYQGQAHEDKLAVLKPFAKKIIAPNDYYLAENYFERLVHTIENEAITYIIGNSFGGLNAYYLSNLKKIPCLLFNPVPPTQAGRFSEYLKIESEPEPFNEKTIVVGLNDEVVPPQETIAFFGARPEQFSKLILTSGLEHRVNARYFQEFCTMLFK